jgi:homocysteine S-methyltransferase
MLADGSEYTGDYDPGDAALRDVHAPRIEALLEAGVDLLAFETIPTVREAAVLLDLLAESGATAWLSYQCRDGETTAAGEPVAEAFALAAGPGVVAVGVTAPTASRAGTPGGRASGHMPSSPIECGDRWDAAERWIVTEGWVDPVRPRRGQRSARSGSVAAVGPGRRTSALAVAVGSRAD